MHHSRSTAWQAQAHHHTRLQLVPVQAVGCSGCGDNHQVHHQQPYQHQHQHQHQHQQHQQPPQHQYWYDEPGPQQLQATLQLPSWRFQTLVNKQPSVLAYQPETLQVTLQALSAALHCSERTVVGIIEQRPALLLQPQDAVQSLHLLSQLLGRTTEQTAFLLSPHPKLLAMPPSQLQQHIQQLCELMHYQSTTDLQQAVAPASFLQLLALPVQRTAGRIQDLSTALTASLEVAAELVQHHPALLNISPAVLHSRLFAIAEADGCSCQELLLQLDQQQLKGLSGLLLLKPKKLMAQLQGLRALLQCVQLEHQRCVAAESRAERVADSQQDSDSSSSSSTHLHHTNHDDQDSSQGGSVDSLAARLLLRLGTRVTLQEAQVKMVGLLCTARDVQAWQQQLAEADDVQLAALVSASHERLAQAKYLAATGQFDGTTLLQAVLWRPTAFSKQWPGFGKWLSGGSVV